MKSQAVSTFLFGTLILFLNYGHSVARSCQAQAGYCYTQDCGDGLNPVSYTDGCAPRQYCCVRTIQPSDHSCQGRGGQCSKSVCGEGHASVAWDIGCNQKQYCCVWTGQSQSAAPTRPPVARTRQPVTRTNQWADRTSQPVARTNQWGDRTSPVAITNQGGDRTSDPVNEIRPSRPGRSCQSLTGYCSTTRCGHGSVSAAYEVGCSQDQYCCVENRRKK